MEEKNKFEITPIEEEKVKVTVEAQGGTLK